MRITRAAIGLGLVMIAMTPQAQAQTSRAPSIQLAQASEDAPPPRRRPRVRIYRPGDERGVYPSYNPGPNAVRDCSATYVQEFRPSGTVITPRVNCYWRRG